MGSWLAWSSEEGASLWRQGPSEQLFNARTVVRKFVKLLLLGVVVQSFICLLECN